VLNVIINVQPVREAPILVLLVMETESEPQSVHARMVTMTMAMPIAHHVTTNVELVKRLLKPVPNVLLEELEPQLAHVMKEPMMMDPHVNHVPFNASHAAPNMFVTNVTETEKTHPSVPAQKELMIVEKQPAQNVTTTVTAVLTHPLTVSFVPKD
jgi:hypothetical protein